MFTFTQGADGSRSMSIDPMPMVAMFMGSSIPASVPQPPPVTQDVTTHGPSDHTPSRAAKTPKATKRSKSQPKAGRDNKALYDEITRLTKSGNIDAAIAKAEGLGWQDHADRLRRKAAEAQTATQSLTRRAKRQPKAETDLADKVADQLVAASTDEPKADTPKPKAPKAPKVTSKGRPASERCSVHNVFKNAEGVCKKCGSQPKAEQPAPSTQGPKADTPKAADKPKPEPKAPKGKVTKVTSLQDTGLLGSEIPLEAFPASVLTEGDLAIHWGNLRAAKHTDILQAALSACRQATVEPRSRDEKILWATRSKTLRNILGIA